MRFPEEGGKMVASFAIASSRTILIQSTTTSLPISHFPLPRPMIGLTRHYAILARETTHLGL
jgi:hypothetical protein